MEEVKAINHIRNEFLIGRRRIIHTFNTMLKRNMQTPNAHNMKFIHEKKPLKILFDKSKNAISKSFKFSKNSNVDLLLFTRLEIKINQI